MTLVMVVTMVPASVFADGSDNKETTNVSGTAHWIDCNDKEGKRPAEVEIVLTGNSSKVIDTQIISEKNDWEWEFNDLPKYNTEGYEIKYHVNIDRSKLDYYRVVSAEEVEMDVPEGDLILALQSYEYREAKVIWNDDNNRDGKRPDTVKCEWGRILPGGNKWKSTFVEFYGLFNESSISFYPLKYNADGSTVKYYMEYKGAYMRPDDEGKEDKLIYEIPGYTYETEDLAVTFTHIPEKIKLSGNITWIDGNNLEGIRPNFVNVTLLANGEPVETVLAEEEENWQWSFRDKYKYENGEEIEYTYEVDVKGYMADADGNEVNMVRSIDVPVNIIWDDDNDRDGVRPDGCMVGLSDEESLGSGKKNIYREISLDGPVSLKCTVPKYYADGTLMEHRINTSKDMDNTLKECGYDITVDYSYENTVISNIDIILEYSPETITLSDSIDWDDDNDRDGKRPDKITLELFGNDDKFIAATEVSAENDWQWSFENVYKNEGGTPIEYFYSVSGADDYIFMDEGTTKITGIYTPEKADLSGQIQWTDGNGIDGKRPESVNIILLANGNVVDSAELTAQDEWKWDFKDKDAYEDGKKIDYSYKIDAVESYRSYIKKDSITLTQQQKMYTQIIWDDGDNQDGKRPESVHLALRCSSPVTEMVYHKAPDWSDEWTKDVFDEQGNRYEYKTEIEKGSKQELEEAGYAVIIDDYIVKLSRPVEKTEVSGLIVWDDADNQDGKRPETVTLELFANGEKADTVKVTAENDWQWSFDDLDKNKAGAEIEYTVKQAEVEGYTSSADGNTFTYVHEPEQTTLPVMVQWHDGDNADGTRPEGVEATLFADGEETAQTLQLTAENDWAAEFSGMDKYKDGKEINYTCEVAETEGYKKVSADNGAVFMQEKDYTATVIWDDADNQDGKRLESVDLVLKQGESEYPGTATAEDWNTSWNQVAYDEEGNPVGFELDVTEESAEALDATGYSISIDGFNVTLSREVELIDYKGQIIWDDADNQDGKRPETVTVDLFSNGEKADTVKATAENDWQWLFDALDKNKSGVEIEYTYEIAAESVATLEAEGYSIVVDGLNITLSRAIDEPEEEITEPTEPDSPSVPSEPADPVEPTDTQEPSSENVPTDKNMPTDEPADTADKTVQSGDDFNLGLYVFVVMMALAVAGIAVRRKES